MPKVSVIIPVYNRPEKLRIAIGSVLRQTMQDFELIIVDDGSTPAIDISAELAGDDRIKLIRTETNGGAAAARNTGAAAARGKWLAWLDSDDRWLPIKLERQFAYVDNGGAKNDNIALASGYRIIKRGRAEKVIPVPATDPLMFFSGCWFCPGSTVILPRKLFEQVGPYDTQLRRLEDLDWFARFALQNGELRVTPDVVVEIERARKQSYEVVSHAADLLLNKYAAQKDGLPSQALTKLRAYLDLERASSALLCDRNLVRGAWFLALSWLEQPRLRLQLENFWSYE